MGREEEKIGRESAYLEMARQSNQAGALDLVSRSRAQAREGEVVVIVPARERAIVWMDLTCSVFDESGVRRRGRKGSMGRGRRWGAWVAAAS